MAAAHWFGSQKNGKLQNGLLTMDSAVGQQIPLVGGPVPSLLLGGIETDHLQTALLSARALNGHDKAQNDLKLCPVSLSYEPMCQNRPMSQVRVYRN